MPRERWKPVVGYEKLYSVSSEGQVRRDGAAKGATVGCMVAPKTGYRDRYPRVELSRGGKRKTYRIHKLVAEAFLPKPRRAPGAKPFVVCHKNDDREDARAANLKWGTSSENNTKR